ncbi:MAG: Protein of unknown function YuxK [Bacteroidota bacterium]
MELPKDKKIILFDGVCNYCNEKVNFIIKHDVKDIFRFTTLQSKIGQEIVKQLGINSSIDSLILVEPVNAYYIKSEAIFKILKQLNTPLKGLLFFNFLPSLVRDMVYEYVVKNRYKWYGKKEVCMIPSPDIQSRFFGLL